jgi:glycosyltransferase involved in cell wall biosynthesis
MAPDLAHSASRPFAFLVSTTPCARVIRSNLGSAAYSYYFVLEALAPVLEELGVWRLIDQPASSLPFAAAAAESQGYRPIHLAINPPQDCYFSPAVPNVILPFWEFPDLPAEDFDSDTRQNWVRACRPASLVLAACEFTARAFERSGLHCPVAVVPVPLDPACFALPDWTPDRSWSIVCRHESWGGDSDHGAAVESAAPGDSSHDQQTIPLRSRAWNAARDRFRQAAKRMDPRDVHKIMRVKRGLDRLRGKSPAKIAYLGLRAGYRRQIRPWLSDEGVERMTRAKEGVLRALGRESVSVDPPPATKMLTLSGLIYTSFLNIGDRRKNWADLLTAFVLAFRDRSDVTLVLKLATSPRREPHEIKILKDYHEKLGIDHRCRIVVITEFLNEEQLAGLYEISTYYVNSSHAEGACLPLMRALAGGRPAIAPAHTAMADYMDDAVGFVVRSHAEPAFWPQDPRMKMITTRDRLVWSDLFGNFLESARVAAEEPERYATLATASRDRMTKHASREVVAAALREALRAIPEQSGDRFSWAS